MPVRQRVWSRRRGGHAHSKIRDQGEYLRFARSLKGRLAITAAIAIVFTGTVVLLFSYFMARSVVREQVFKSMEGVVSRTRREVEITVGDMDAAATSIAARPQLAQDLDSYLAGSTGRDALIADLQSMPAAASPAAGPIKEITVVSIDGTVIASAGGTTQGATRKIAAGALENIKAGHNVTTFGLDNDGLVITVAAPLTKPGTDQLDGALVVQDRSAELESELSDTSGLGTTGSILLSDFVVGKVSVLSFKDMVKTGSSAVATSRGTLLRLPLTSELPPVKAARGEKGEGESNGLLGSVVASYDFVPGPAWGVTATTSSNEALSPIYKLRNVSIIVILVLLFGGSLLAYMIARSISRPLTELQEGVKALASGDLSTRVTISDGVEVTSLATEFNKMTARLDDLYNTLEHKVQERTIELQEANDRLKELDNLKSEFVSMASHELRSPMASMKMGVSTVLREMVGPLNDDQKQMLDIAERNIDRLTDLTSELLDLTKIEAGQLDIDLQDCDLLELAREAVASDEPMAKEKGLAIKAVSHDGEVVARCDRDRIYQVIQNIVNNALKFTDEGGVTISVGRTDDSVQVCVEDTGAGIPPDSVETIFEKWSRAHSETRSEMRGTGLGLAICKGIVEAHGGEISLDSELGKGTKVCFTLPPRGPDAREKKDTDSR
jgi:signal transduction histidine kinase